LRDVATAFREAANGDIAYRNSSQMIFMQQEGRFIYLGENGVS
jgi:hypothetical protein